MQAPATAPTPRMNSVPDHEKSGVVVSSRMKTRATAPHTTPAANPRAAARRVRITRPPGGTPAAPLRRRCGGRSPSRGRRPSACPASGTNGTDAVAVAAPSSTVMSSQTSVSSLISGGVTPGEHVGVVVGQGCRAVAGDARAEVEVRTVGRALGRGADPRDPQDARGCPCAEATICNAARGAVERARGGGLEVGQRAGGPDDGTAVTGIRRGGEGEECHDGRERHEAAGGDGHGVPFGS